MKLFSEIVAWLNMDYGVCERPARVVVATRAIRTGFLLWPILQLATFGIVPVHAQKLGKGVFEHHTHVYSPLVKGYPSPTISLARAELDALLANPYISGVQLTYDWKHLEPTPGSYRWDIVDADIAPWAAVGKKVWIEIQTANKRTYAQAPRGFPQWLIQAPYNVPTVGTYHIDSSGTEHTQYPVFWNPTYQQRYESFIAAFAARFDGHPSIEFVSITGYSAGTEPRLSTEDNSYYYSAWMAAGLDPGLTLDRINRGLFYSSSEAAELGVQPVYLNTNKWALDLFDRYFSKTQLMVNVTKWDVDWQNERYLYAVTRGIGIGNNGLTARSDSEFRELALATQLTYGVPVGYFEFGPDTRLDFGPDMIQGTADDFSIKLLEVYRRGMGIDGTDPTYAPWGRISYMPAGKQEATLESAQEWSAALAWALGAELTLGGTSTSDTTPPTTPTGLNRTSVTSSTISLSWIASTDNVAVAGYTLSRNGVAVANTATTSYTDSNLAPATNYTYTVAAYDTTGNSSSPSVAYATSTTTGGDTLAPVPPTALAATGVSSSRIDLSWAASTDNVAVTGYKIYRDGAQIATTTARTYSAKGLSRGTTYKFSVAAYDAAGNTSAQSSTIRAKTLQ